MLQTAEPVTHERTTESNVSSGVHRCALRAIEDGLLICSVGKSIARYESVNGIIVNS